MVAKQCVLTGDVDLAAAGMLEIGSFTSFNCRGHRIFTSSPGTDINHRSSPEVGVFLRGVQGVTLRNCVIDGFDFPILMANSKLPPGGTDHATLQSRANNLVGNTVTGRYTGITLVNVDNTRIKDSSITITNVNGLGIYVLRDSDQNEIKNNTIAVHANNDASGAMKLPGPVLISNPISAGASGSGGILVTQGTGVPTLLNAVIGGQLYQFTTSDSPVPNDDFGADNTISGNTIDTVVPSQMNDIGVSVSARISVRDNKLGAARIGVLFGAASYQVTLRFPGTCSTDPGRRCLSGGSTPMVCSGDNGVSCTSNTACTGKGTCVTNDCFISAIDAVSKGTCGPLTDKLVLWISEDPIIESNTITGPLLEGIQIAAPNALIQGNDITGPTWPATDFTVVGGVGIGLRRFALQSATVTRNRVSNFVAPIRLLSNAPAFGAHVMLNDFYPGNAEILLDSPTFAAELSAAGSGNYWGLACSDHGGFDPDKAIVVTSGTVDANGNVSLVGVPTANIHDSHPYGVPVAALDDISLPSPCSTP